MLQCLVLTRDNWSKFNLTSLIFILPQLSSWRYIYSCSPSYCLLRTHPGIQQWNKDTTLSRRHSLLLASHSLCSSSSHHILDSLNRYGVKYLYYFFQNCWGIKCVVNNYFNCFKVNFGYLLYVWTPSFGSLLKMYFQIHFWRKKKHYMKYFFFPLMKMLILEDT